MLTPLKDLIQKSASKFQLQGEINAVLVITRANSVLKDIFSTHICRCLQVKKFSGGILWLAVENAAVAQEVQMKTTVLIQSINDSLGLIVVKQIRSYQVTAEPEEYHS